MTQHRHRSGAPGMSIVICCHNSASRLPVTLQHLAAQHAGGIAWEVLVIDNASTDDTTQVARTHWPSPARAPLRVLQERRLGKGYAQDLGMKEARYDLVSIVDDDNWLAPDWIPTAQRIMDQHPEAGACGGYSAAVFERTPPDWFEKYQEHYGVGPQGEPGDVTWEPGYLRGAGMVIRKAAWEQMIADGYEWKVMCRQGDQLSSGGDTELCYALRLAGWRLRYEPLLRLEHFMTAPRLNWEYLCRLNRGFGAQAVGLFPYLGGAARGGGLRLRDSWQWHAVSAARTLVRSWCALALVPSQHREGHSQVLLAEQARGRLLALVKQRTEYRQHLRSLRTAAWRHSDRRSQSLTGA